MKTFLLIVVMLALGAAGGVVAQRYWLHDLGMAMQSGSGAGAGKKILYYRNPMTPTLRSDKPMKDEMGMDYIPVYAEAATETKKADVLYYRNPMMPSITSDKPMQDEMGMDYIPVYADAAANRDSTDSTTVSISPTVISNMGVRTARVQRGPLTRRIDTFGYVSFNESTVQHIHLRSEGWVENLVVKFVGERVKKGELLLELYSPRLVNAQQEYLQSLSTGNKLLLGATRTRLRSLGVPDELIERVENTRRIDRLVQVYAPQDGVVTALNIRQGMYVEPSTEAMSLAGMADIWVMAEVLEAQSGWVRPGQQAEMRLSAWPGRLWSGAVDYIYPSLDPVTRTLKVRVRFANPDEVLKPNMLADVAIIAATPSTSLDTASFDAAPFDAAQDRLSIPREALIRSSEGARVIMALGQGKFRPRSVRAGMESGERVEITGGLTEGEEVVSSGQFLLDSESSLNASFTRMTPVDDTKAALVQPVQSQSALTNPAATQAAP